MFGFAESEHPMLTNGDFGRIPTYVITIHQRYRQTDGQTVRQTDDMRSQDCALHYSASRGKN